jgi:hypothetical protein
MGETPRHSDPGSGSSCDFVMVGKIGTFLLFLGTGPLSIIKKSHKQFIFRQFTQPHRF